MRPVCEIVEKAIPSQENISMLHLSNIGDIHKNKIKQNLENLNKELYNYFVEE